MSHIREKVSNLASKVIYNYVLQRLYKKSTANTLKLNIIAQKRV